MLLQSKITLPSPNNEAERAELTRVEASLGSDYGKGKFCPPEDNGKCYTIGDANKIMASSRNPKELKKIWDGWHTISPPYKKDYARLVELGNKGARELGYTDIGALWRSTYDMPPDDFAADQERVWQQVKPLYDFIHLRARATS